MDKKELFNQEEELSKEFDRLICKTLKSEESSIETISELSVIQESIKIMSLFSPNEEIEEI